MPYAHGTPAALVGAACSSSWALEGCLDGGHVQLALHPTDDQQHRFFTRALGKPAGQDPVRVVVRHRSGGGCQGQQ